MGQIQVWYLLRVGAAAEEPTTALPSSAAGVAAGDAVAVGAAGGAVANAAG